MNTPVGTAAININEQADKWVIWKAGVHITILICLVVYETKLPCVAHEIVLTSETTNLE